MDENTWKLLQIAMWLLGIQTTVIIAIMGIIYASISKKLDKAETKSENTNILFNDIDKRLFAIETMLHMKDCCALKENTHKKAE